MPNSKGPLTGSRNKLSNSPRERGTSPPQRAVEEYEEGQTVHLALDPSVPEGRFHPRFNGLTGKIEGQQGSAYQVAVTDGNDTKTIIARPAHLRAQQ